MDNLYRIHPQPAFNFNGLVIDNFAGGGGASTGIELGLGRPVDIAINHDPEAVAMHDINHPHTRHFCESAWEVDPRDVVDGRPVDLCWFSPDCKHFSKAKGGAPVKKEIRGLAWVAIRYAATAKPKVIMLETITSKLGTGLVVPTLAPFITEHANGSSQRNMPAGAPLRTICAQVKGGHFAVVAPTLVQVGYGERKGQAPRVPGLDKPLGTCVAGGNKHALVAAFLAKHYGGNYTGPGSSLESPLPTATTVDHNALVTSHLVKLRNKCIGQDLREPVHTLTTGGHMSEVRAFLLKYYGTGDRQPLQDPLHTVTTKDRHALVMIKGEPYQIVDIGMRMLEPHELFAAQGFPADYIHDRTADGKKLSKAAQVRMCGNSVCPPVAAALVRANLSAQQLGEDAA